VNAEVFIDREAELAALERLWRSPHPELSVLYGRRQVGKG
jgi:AAA+ ATPase superfamily predicted ATPase